MTLEEILALLPDNSVGAIDAADLRTAVTELWARSSTVGQVFSYRWATSPGPGTGRVAGPWVIGSGIVQLSETTEDGATLSYAILDALPGTVLRVIADGGASVLRATVTGLSVDQGNYRDVPVLVESVTGPAPAANAKVSVAITGVIP